MKSVLLRTGSGTISLRSSIAPSSPRVSLSVHDCVGRGGGKGSGSSQRISLHSEVNRRSIRRSASESDVICSEIGGNRLSKYGSQSFPTRIAEDEYVAGHEGAVVVRDIGSMTWTEDRIDQTAHWSDSGVQMEELGFTGGGLGKQRKSGGGGGGNEDRRKIRAYYEEMVKSNPTNSLILRNYGKYLHEVEKDAVKAEEYYGRAVLASPGDGEVLSLYGNLIWETQRDESRAKSYFDQAVQACPEDCMVLGSYAHFMWEAEEEEDEIETENGVVFAQNN